MRRQLHLSDELLITAVQPAKPCSQLSHAGMASPLWVHVHRHHHRLRAQQQKFLHTCWSKRLQIWGVQVPTTEGDQSVTGWAACPKPSGGESFCVCLCVQPTVSQRGGMPVRHWTAQVCPISPVFRREEQPSVLLALQLDLELQNQGAPPQGRRNPFNVSKLHQLQLFSLILTVITIGHSRWRTQQLWLTQLTFQKASHQSSLYLCTVICSSGANSSSSNSARLRVKMKAQGRNLKFSTASCAQMCPSALSLAFSLTFLWWQH